MLENHIENIPEKIRLPLLSTGKPHISYSEYSDWDSCLYRHKLKYIDLIQLDSDSIHTIYGQVIHKALEERINLIKGLISEVNTPKYWVDVFQKQFKEYFEKTTFKNQEEIKKVLDLEKRFVTTFQDILEGVTEWLNSQFESWEPVEVEVQIYEPITQNEAEGYFKGFIDLVIRTPKFIGRGATKQRVEGEYIYWVLDWKTTDWGWTRYNKESFKKQVQLLCYKNYYSKIKNIPLEDIKCAWILVKRKPKKGEIPFELVLVSSTEKKVEEAIFVMRTMVTSLYRKLYLKNYKECLYCVYRPTGHCSLTPDKKP